MTARLHLKPKGVFKSPLTTPMPALVPEDQMVDQVGSGSFYETPVYSNNVHLNLKTGRLLNW